ncbi:MAG: secretin N-terminal domain-containing protein [Candidatus Didemnitutus sp.]|nr:secretin N-terminal domain-containing protein [Candidatus Didemnitutus sp.]
MSTRQFTSTLLALTLLASAHAQTESTPTEVTVVGAAPVQGTAMRDRDTLSVDFPDEDIRTILRNVADLFELNLVVPDTLVGRTSIKLRDVTWRQIFQVVLSQASYTYVEEGNIIKVVSNESLTLEPVSTEVFILNNAKAQDIKPTIDGLVDAALGGKILIDARSNALVVTERPSRMTRIHVIIEQLDKATAQVMIESRFVEVTDRDIRNIGVNWASLQGMTLGARSLGQSVSRGRGQEATGTVDTTATNTHEDQVLYGTLFQPVNSTTSLPSGAVTMPGSSPSITAPTGDALQPTATTTTRGEVGNTIESLTKLINTGDTSRLATAVFSASDFNIIVSALKSQNNTKVVSNPTIVTLNNSEATLNIGSEFPVPSYTYNSERGTFEVSGFQYKPIGIILKVTPQVNAQGTIRLALEPEVSQQNGSTTFGGAGGANIPIIATRKVKTQVSLKDGYTAGIGGLIQQSKDHGGTKVPVLGSIPLLGRLFSSKSVNDQSSNLLIFVTAKTVNPDGAAPADIFAQSALDATGEGVPVDPKGMK